MQNTDRNLDGIITAKQAAKLLGVRLDYMRRLKVLQALVPSVAVGELLLYREDDVRVYKDTHPALGQKRRKQ